MTDAPVILFAKPAPPAPLAPGPGAFDPAAPAPPPPPATFAGLPDDKPPGFP